MARPGHPAKMARRADAPGHARGESPAMHSEYVEGLVLRPSMDAGYTAWRDGRCVGVARFAEGRIDVEADEEFARRALVRRLGDDLRAAGITMPACASSSQGQPASSDGRSSGFWPSADTKSAA